MPIDVQRAIGAVVREIASREVDGRACRVIVASRRYDTDPDDLWDALTSAERIPRWFLPISGELRLGGRFQFEGNAGGTIVACEPPARLAVTWGMHGQESDVVVTLTAVDGGTLLRLEHVAEVPDEMWRQYGPGAVGIGWESGLLGLGLHIAGDGASRPKDPNAWLASPEGRAFVAGSSDGWARASIAAGDDPDAATAAAARIAAMYTGDASA